MTQQPKQKLARKSSPNLSDVPPEFLAVYDRKTCQRCQKPISKKRLENCKKRRFWPVCRECEPIVIEKYRLGIEKLTEIKKRFG